MAMQKTTFGTILVLAVMGLIASGLGALVTTRTLTNTGNIQVVTTPPASVQLGVYSDHGCTNALSSITWGTLSPGATATATIFLRNEGNVPITLSIQATNWNPSTAASYLTLGWNCTSLVLQPNVVVQALLTLAVSSSISSITSFSFDVTITAAQ